MKQKFLTKALSVLLAAIMMVSVVPMAAITSLADEAGAATTGSAVESTLTPAEAIEKEMAERSTITKDRSAGEPGPYAVFVDGELYASGEFYKVWNMALDKAAFIVEDEEHSNVGRSRNVEFVLYADMMYKSDWFSEETMTISNRLLTIDLNGHLLWRLDQGGSVIKVDDHSTVNIMDSNPTSVHAGKLDKYGMWSPSSGGSTKIKGGVICGGYLRVGDGGGIAVDNGSTVYLYGGTIAGNKADVGSGVYLDNGSTLNMSMGNSQICYNYCAGTMTDGGTVFLRGGCKVIGGYIHHNLADDYGGGVRAKGGDILIQDVVIYANKAEEYGGGIYTERSMINQTVTVTGCKIVSNYAGKKGGGGYLWDLYLTDISDCIVENNSAAKVGGGICIGSFMGTDVKISGKMIIRNNHVSTSDGVVNSNLCLEGDDDLIVGSLTLDSEVWVRTGTAASSYSGVKHTLLDRGTDTSQHVFFADESGYCVKYQDDPAKANYRHLYLEKGEKNDPVPKYLDDYSTKQQTTPYRVETGKNKGTAAPLYKGYFEYNLMSTDKYYSASPFYYSDGYFFEDPTYYNTHLATMSINVAVAAFGRMTDQVGDNAYANHFANVKQLFADIGCADTNFFANEDYQMKPAYYGEEDRLSTIGVAISQKEISMNGESYTLVPVAIRGGGYEVEWASNVSIGASGEADGFSDAARQVHGHVQNYIANYGLADKVASGKVKFWVVGYSRAGATANITSKYLVDSYAEVGNQIFGYTFEAPMGGNKAFIKNTEYTGFGKYPTIHNTVNELDFVTLVAPTEMGFIRYGVDHLVGSTKHEEGISYDVNSDYYKQRMKMIAQLSAINPYYKFNDSWQVADVNIVLGNIPVVGTNIVDQGEQIWDDPNPECKNMYTLLRWFFLRIQGDGLLLPEVAITDPKNPNKTIYVSDTSYSREYFSTYKPLADIVGNPKTAGNYGYSEMSVQEAAAALMTLVMESLTDEQMTNLMNAMMINLGLLKGEFVSFHFWDQSLFDYVVDQHDSWVAYPIAAYTAAMMPFAMDVAKLVELYVNYIYDWDTYDSLKKAELIDWLMKKIFTTTGGVSIWTVLTEEQADLVAEALPVVLWFVLNYASMDYNTGDHDDGMWGVGTFINNMSSIVSNHYQEVSVAWVRSYDSYYANDLQAYMLDTSKIQNNSPTGEYKSGKNTLTLTDESGSSIFYSTDGGNTWELYTDTVSFAKTPQKVLYFSIYRGVKSPVYELFLGNWVGSLITNGSFWFIVAGGAILVGLGITLKVVSKKRRKAENKQ